MKPLALALLSSCLLALGCFGADDRQDAAALKDLFSKRGSGFAHRRDELLRERRAFYDAKSLANESWQAGLLALLLNRRMERAETYAEWDRADMRSLSVSARSGKGFMAHPATQNPEGQLYCIELFFAANFSHEDLQEARRYRPELAEEDELRCAMLGKTLFVLRGGALSGPVEVWRAVWEGARDNKWGVLRDGALRAILMSNTDEGLAYATAVCLDKNTTTDQLGLLLGSTLGRIERKRAFEFLRKTEEVYETVRSSAYATNLARVGLPEAREYLYSLLLNPEKPTWFRAFLAEQASVCHQPTDVSVGKALLECKEQGERKLGVRLLFGNWGAEMPWDKALLLTAAERADDSETAMILARFLGRRARKGDLPVLERLMRQEGLTREERSEIAGLIKGAIGDDTKQ